MSELIDYKKKIKDSLRKIDKKNIGSEFTKRAIYNLDIVARHSEKEPVFNKRVFVYKGEKFINYSVRFNDNYQLTGTTLPNLMKTICHYFERSRVD